MPASNTVYTPLRTGDSGIDRNLDLIKSALDAVGSTTATIAFTPVIGSPQTANGSTSSASPAKLSNTATVTVKPSVSGNYKVFAAPISASSDTAGSIFTLSIVSTTGSPTLLVNGRCVQDVSAGIVNVPLVMSPMAIYQLSANVSYTFEIWGSTTAGTVTANFSARTNGYLMVEEF